jgi:hypothetical protein
LYLTEILSVANHAQGSFAVVVLGIDIDTPLYQTLGNSEKVFSYGNVQERVVFSTAGVYVGAQLDQFYGKSSVFTEAHMSFIVRQIVNVVSPNLLVSSRLILLNECK